jgi:hypothetical protein
MFEIITSSLLAQLLSNCCGILRSAKGISQSLSEKYAKRVLS